MIDIVVQRIATALVLFSVALLASCDDDKPAPDAPPVPIDASFDASSTCGGTVAYLQLCTMDNDCESCVCKNFGHNMNCTKACTVPADCPAPSGGCSAGFCRP